MPIATPIPVYQLFGETAPFPDVMHCERVRDRAPRHDWSIAPHRHAHMVQAVELLSGRARARLDAEEHDMMPGDFVYVPAQVVHSFRFAEGAEGRVMSFPLPLLAPLATGSEALGKHLTRPLKAQASKTLSALFDQLDATYGQDGTFRAQLLSSLAQTVLCAICNDHASPLPAAEPRSDLLARFDALLQAHLAEGWQAADYASALGVSTGHLSRLCRDARGLGARRLIDEAVMTEACRMLAFTRLPVSEIGYRLGFEDPPHFSRRFRVLRGETPSDYRRRFSSDAVGTPLPAQAQAG